MRRTIRYALSLLMFAAVAVAPTSVTGQTELGGVYLSHGLNPDGSQYMALVHIARHGDSFLVTWISPEAADGTTSVEPTAVGVGIVSGPTLAVSYYSQDASGVIAYRIEDDGRRLEGRWTVAGGDGAASIETLTNMGSLPDPAEPDSPKSKRPLRRSKTVWRTAEMLDGGRSFPRAVSVRH